VKISGWSDAAAAKKEIEKARKVYETEQSKK